MVHNISPGGARITLSEAAHLGAELKVHIPQRNLSRNARLVWRKGDHLGVAFLSEDAASPAETEVEKDEKLRAMAARVATLKAEIGVLK